MRKKVIYISLGVGILWVSITLFFLNLENDKIDPNQITCLYSTSNPNASLGISDATAGFSSGNGFVDGFNAVMSFLDDLQSNVQDHRFSCSYNKSGIQDKRFINQIKKGY